MRDIKIVVAHPAQQHSYRLATALKNKGVLFKYITTVYDKDKVSLMKFIKIFLSKRNLKRANSRRCEDLSDDLVKQFCQSRGFIELLLLRINIDLYRRWSKRTTDIFGRKVANYAIKNNVDAVIMYDTKALKCFEILKNKQPNIKRILDMSAPNIAYMDKIFKEDVNLEGDMDNLKDEFNSKIYKEKLKDSMKEISITDYFLTASNFTRDSLIFSGINDRKISVCSYGIDTNIYKNEFVKSKNESKINVVLIGRATQKKGFFYFLNAIEGLDLEKYNFTIIGEFDKTSEYYKKYKNIYNFTGLILKDELIKVASQNDVMVFPSLADGFGFSALEALALGLPVISSKNAGISDLIINEYNGFLVEARDSKAIRERIVWFQENKSKLYIMKENAIKTAKVNTWEKYYDKISDDILNYIN